ncbi:MAG: BON domain-containing protein [Kibdelosporangium sp.]
MSRLPRWWLWAAVLVPAVLTVAGLTVLGGGIERSVGDSVRAVLPGAKVVVNGRDVTISGVPAELLPAARKAVEDLPAAGSVSTVEPNYAPMRIVFRGGEVIVTGNTERPAWRDHFLRAIGRQAPGRQVVDQVRTAPNTDFPITTSAAATTVAVIARQSVDLTVAVERGKVTVAGVVPDDGRRSEIVDTLRRLFGADTLIDQTRTKE